MYDHSVYVYAVARNDPSGASLLGTAFAVGGRKLVTAYHVVGPSDDALCILIPRIVNLNSYQDSNQAPIVNVKILEADPVRDICVLEFANGSAANPPFKMSGSDGVAVGESVVTLGFPHAPDGRYVLTHHRAHVGARVMLGSRTRKYKHFVLNTQARPGQSGSPIFNQSMSSVVGMLIGSFARGGGGSISLGGVDPATLHQTTHAISAEYIKEML